MMMKTATNGKVTCYRADILTFPKAPIPRFFCKMYCPI